MTAWQPIETVPTGGPDIFVYGQFIREEVGGPEMMIATWQGEWHVPDYQCGGHYPMKDFATHWTPLPEPPK